MIGRTGKGNYGHGLDVVWKRFPNTPIVAVADENPAGLAAAAAKLGVRATYADYREMLRAEKPDIVAVAPRWVDCHHDMVIAAAESRASIYLEKPMARTLAEADRMIAACDRAHVKLAVAHQMRISPILDLARRRIAEGAIGQIQELRGRGKEDRRAGGEDLMVLGTHVMDLMRQFAGDPLWAFGRVTARGRDITRADIVDGPEGLGPIAGDAIAGTFAFRDGITGYFASKKSDDSSGVRFGLDIYGSRGVMTIRAGMDPDVRLLDSTHWTGAAWTPLALPGNPPKRDDGGANQALAADLLEAIEQDRPARAGGAEARWTLEMVMALYESQRAGGRVRLPLERREHPLSVAQ
ncbi:MAG: Gfo/Idh/MocA family oxidoreductase [Candidatus Solibacter usitatus]|nr:Gfo/Idh/MocA family oxidoreductase [Candidatus Solibacter usitatus]